MNVIVSVRGLSQGWGLAGFGPQMYAGYPHIEVGGVKRGKSALGCVGPTIWVEEWGGRHCACEPVCFSEPRHKCTQSIGRVH